MTTSVKVVCTGNTDGDEVRITRGWRSPANVGGFEQIVLRGDVSDAMSAGPGDEGALWLRIEGRHNA